MPITKVAFHVLAVGQGNGTVVVFYDDTGAAVDTAMMDFGSDTSTISVSGDAAVGWTVTLLTAMAANKKISTVCFSHSDYDHISLMQRLLDKFPGGHATLPVGSVFYGGTYDDYKKYGVNVLESLVPYTAGATLGAGLPPSNTSFDGDTATPLVTVQDTSFYLLVANTAAMYSTNPKRKRTGYFKNTESMVVIADCRGNQFVMPGDATGATMVKANKIVAASKGARDHLTSVFHTTVPHHGSIRTASEVQYFAGIDWRTVLTEYVNNLKAWSASASAGVQNKHKHPNANILEFFWKAHLRQNFYQDPALAPSNRHYFTAYVTPENPIGTAPDTWPPATMTADWRTLQSTYAIFTNDYWGPFRDRDEIVPPLPVVAATPVPWLGPGAVARPGEVHWEFLLDFTANALRVTRVDAHPTVVALGRAINSGAPPEEHPPVPDWYALLDEAHAAGPTVVLPLVSGDPPPHRAPDPS